MSRYRIYITTGDFDQKKYPIPPKRVNRSAAKCNHTPTPELYHARYEWSERASKTHSQVRCPRCGLWAIWLPKAEARRINLQDAREDRRLAKQIAKEYPSQEAEYIRETKRLRKESK